MSGRVIQARYLGGRPGAQLLQLRPVGAPPLAGAVQAKGRPGLAGPPPLAGQAGQAGHAPVVPSRALQAHRAAESFAVDPVRLGLGQGRGRPLPDAVRAKMEAAFNTDFSGVRVHEGPQAARIGAIAFTTGHDIYFAPGQYRPETVQGQQLLGHELAHVVQQRQGRVKAPGSGVSVVQDHALEAEADRLGMRAALPIRAAAQLQRKVDVGTRFGAASMAVSAPRHLARTTEGDLITSDALTIQPMSWGMIGILGALGGATVGAGLAGFVGLATAYAAGLGGAIGLGVTEVAGRYLGGGNPNVPETGKGKASIYDETKKFDKNTMAISRVVYNRSKGHTLVVFEWTDEEDKSFHQIYHFAGDEAPFWSQATVGGSGSVKFVSDNNGRPKGVETFEDVHVKQSTPETFFNKSKYITWDSYAETWIVDKKVGKLALKYARKQVGVKKKFRVTPWLPSAYNCVQMANEILEVAGIYPESPFQYAQSIFAPRMNSNLKKVNEVKKRD